MKNFLKKIFLINFVLLSLFSLKVKAAGGADDSDYVMTWASSGSAVYTDESNGLIMYQANETYGSRNGLYSNVSNCCSVYNTTLNRIYIFAESGTTGTYATWDFVREAGLGHSFNPTYVSISFSPVVGNNNLSNIPDSGSTSFNEWCPLSSDYVYWSYTIPYAYQVCNADYIVADWADLYNALAEDDFIAGGGGGGSGGDPWLPNLTFSLSRKTTYVFPNVFDTKCFIDWDYTEKEIYSSNPSEYVVDVQVSGSVNEAGVLNGDNLVPQVGHILTLSAGGCNVAQNEFTFLYQGVGKQFYQTYGFNEFPPRDNNSAGMAAGYFLYLRTREISTGRTSPWKIFSAVGGQFFPVNKTIEGSDGDYTIEDVPQDELDNSDDSLIIDYTSDNNNSAEDDPTSQMYNEESQYNVSAVINNLKSAVNSLNELPAMLGQVLAFMPPWLISLIGVSIGLLVVIGVVKHILR